MVPLPFSRGPEEHFYAPAFDVIGLAGTWAGATDARACAVIGEGCTPHTIVSTKPLSQPCWRRHSAEDSVTTPRGGVGATLVLFRRP